MGKSNNVLQELQLFERRPDPRGSGPNYKSLLEREIIKHLISKYKDKHIVIMNDPYCYLENWDLDVDLNFLRIIFGDFNRVTVNQFGVHVGYQ